MLRAVFNKSKNEHPYKTAAGSARGVMVIVVGNGHGDTSSNPIILPQAMGN